MSDGLNINNREILAEWVQPSCASALAKAYIARGLKEAGIKLLGSGETQQLFPPNSSDDVVGTITGFHYTESNTNPQNIELKNQLHKMFGRNAVSDIAMGRQPSDLQRRGRAWFPCRRVEVHQVYGRQEARQPARTDHDRSNRARCDLEYLHPQSRKARRQARQCRHRHHPDGEGPMENRSSAKERLGKPKRMLWLTNPRHIRKDGG